MPLSLTLDLDRRIPIYRQIYEGVLAGLASGSLERDEQLPTIHQLASDLGCNPNTVARAYRDLERDGHIVSQRGRGTFAAEQAPARTREARDSLLSDIFKGALAEAARHGLSARELASYFQTRFRKTLQGEARDNKRRDRK
ncbi:MAG: GntR family transcriptional regulator [Myxococcales bacterium]|nr:GntR family transcriptional regulator [Myxococcales bacterium]